MKKILKIFGLTLGGIVGVVLLVVCALLWVVFTPERLTPIVRQVADKIITCEPAGHIEIPPHRRPFQSEISSKNLDR